MYVSELYSYDFLKKKRFLYEIVILTESEDGITNITFE